jgi:hypothetical protein
VNGTNYEVPHSGAFSTPHSHEKGGKALQMLATLNKNKYIEIGKKR